MPRRDGFPTNPEMLVDFTSEACEVVNEAYDVLVAADFPAAYQDKPLKHLYFRLMRRTVPGHEHPPVRGEALTVRPLDEDMAEILDEHLHFRTYPENALAAYRKTAADLGKVTLQRSFQLRDALTPTGTDADYVLSQTDGRTRHVATFKEKPAKQTIAGAKFFASEALDFVRSPDIRPGNKGPGLPEDLYYMHPDADKVVVMQFGFDMAPELPLNGYESAGFLASYAHKMHERATHYAARIERLMQLQAPKDVLQECASLQARYQAALDRARRILDQ